MITDFAFFSAEVEQSGIGLGIIVRTDPPLALKPSSHKHRVAAWLSSFMLQR